MIEVCCGSFEDAMAAYEGGADEIELNSALSIGGLTPSLGSLIMVKQYTELKVVSMVRMRGAGFCYTDYQYEQMLEDAKLLISYGTDGIAFGFLKEDRTIDERKVKEFTNLIHDAGRKAVFHRAFDCVKDPYETMEQLIALGVDRVLTSGLQKTAEEGIPLLKELQERYGNRIELTVGSGIHAGNAEKIRKETGIERLHSSCKTWKTDDTSIGENVSFGYMAGEKETSYETVSIDETEKLTALCR